MANSTNSPEKITTDQQPSAGDNPNPSNSDLPDSSAAVPPSAIPATTTANAAVVPVNPNPNPTLINPQLTPAGIPPPPPPQIQGFVPQSQPSFRPSVPLPTAPQFSPIPNPNPSFQNHVIQGGQGQGQVQIQVQPPGVMMPSQMMPPQYGQQPMRMYAPMPNGYQMAVPPGAMNPPVR